jgi:hypothetical protein
MITLLLMILLRYRPSFILMLDDFIRDPDLEAFLQEVSTEADADFESYHREHGISPSSIENPPITVQRVTPIRLRHGRHSFEDNSAVQEEVPTILTDPDVGSGRDAADSVESQEKNVSEQSVGTGETGGASSSMTGDNQANQTDAGTLYNVNLTDSADSTVDKENGRGRGGRGRRLFDHLRAMVP